MKNKLNLLFVSAIALVSAGFVFSSASAQETLAVKPEKVVEAQGTKGGNPNVTDTTVNTTITTTNEQAPQDKIKKDNKENETGQMHRSKVATFVQSLLTVADREGGIGQEVRVIAQQQNDTSNKVAEEISTIEKRGKLKTFFIGTDYKNTGELRSQMVQTRNQIDQLKRLAEKAENPQSKVELQTQIESLEKQQEGINDFIIQNESKFSLFGWAVKFFQ